MSQLSPEARALLDAALPSFEPSEADLERAMLRARETLGDELSRVPPANVREQHVRARLLRFFLLALLAGASLRPLAPRHVSTAPIAARASIAPAPAPTLPAPVEARRVTPAPTPPPPPRARITAAPRRPRLYAQRSIATDAVRSARTTPALSSAPEAPMFDLPPSDAMNNAVRLYQQDRCALAAPQLQRVVEGETRDGRPQIERAQALLARCLVQLGYRHAALAVFTEIAEAGRAHSRFADTLPWLEHLSRTVAEPAGIASVVGRYEPGDIDALGSSYEPQLRGHLRLLMGRARYDEARFDEAISLLDRVEARHPAYVRARVLAALAHVRSRHANPAVTALRAALNALQSGGPTERDRAAQTDLVWMQLARVYYSTRHYESALDAWQHVREGSALWGDVLFESAWARYLTGDDPHALGNVHSLATPYFDRAFYPEAFVLRAVIQFSHCQYEDTEEALGEYHRRFDGLREHLEARLEGSSDAAANVQLVRDLRSGLARFPARLAPVVAGALSDLTVQRHLRYLDDLQAEREHLRELPELVQRGALGGRILQELAIAQGLANEGAGELVRQRFRRAVEELRDLDNQATAVAIELLSARRADLQNEQNGQNPRAHAPSRRNVWAVDTMEDGAVWPYTGEVWEDEVGNYRQNVDDRCGR